MPRKESEPTALEAGIAAEIRRHAGKYVALARDWSRVVAVGESWRKAREKAIELGFPDAPVILAARDYSAVAFACLDY